MGKAIPDLWDNCYDGEHRKLLAPEQFKQMFCNVCMNVGCSNSRGAGTKWSHRMMTQEDRLLHNPAFAPDNTAEIMGLPDFKNMIQEALRIEISTQRGDWEPVTDADVGRVAAEMMGVIPPTSFQTKPDPTSDLIQQESGKETPKPEGNTPQKSGHEHSSVDAPLTSAPIGGQWRVRGDSTNKEGKPRTYTVTLNEDGAWGCSCPSREVPCKHARYIQGRLAPPTNEPVPDPVRPDPAPRRAPFPTALNTSQPQSGVMVGGASPPPTDPVDPWAVSPGTNERKIDVGGKVTFGSGNTKK